MARKEINSVDYFPHGVTHGRKMHIIRHKHGNDGYAVWFMLLEELGRASYHFLDLKDPVNLMYLSSTFRVSENQLLEIINDLVKLEEFDQILWEKECILYNQKFVDNIQDAYKRRQNACVNRNSLIAMLWQKSRLRNPLNVYSLPDNVNINEDNANINEDNVCGSIQSKVKESKVDKKGNKLPQKDGDNFAGVEPHLSLTVVTKTEGEKEKKSAPKKEKELQINNPFDEQFLEVWARWKKYKSQQHRFTYKSELSENAALAKLFELSNGSRELAGKIIDQSISQGWSGLFELKHNQQQQHKQPKRDKVEEAMSVMEKVAKMRGLA